MFLELFVQDDDHLQGQWHSHLPGQPIPALDHSFREGIFPNIQPEILVLSIPFAPLEKN